MNSLDKQSSNTKTCHSNDLDDEGNFIRSYEEVPVDTPFNVRVREGCRLYEVKTDNNIIYEYAQVQGDYDSTARRTGIPEPYRYVKMKDFRTDIYMDRMLANKAKDMVKQFIVHFSKFASKGVGLYIYSPSSGAGKTLLASVIINALIRKYDEMPKFIKATTFFEESKRALRQVNKDNPVAEDRIRMLTNAKVLIIDDLGAEKVTDYINTLVYELISKRTDLRKVTIITSRKKLEELKYDTSTISQVNASTRLIELPNENVGLRVSNESNRELDQLLEGKE